MITRYDIKTETLIEVTQDWVNNTQDGVNCLGLSRAVLKKVLELHPINDKELLLKIEAILETKD